MFDLFHRGHLEHFRKIHTIFDTPIELIVGIISDKVTSTYKRTPIFDETKRYKILNSCVYIHDAFITDTLVIDEEYMIRHNIDYVVHAFSNSDDRNKQTDFFKIPIELNKFIEIEYNHGVSTTQIIKETKLDWSQIWAKKGDENTDNLYLLNGWESTNFNPELFISKVINTLSIRDAERILEVGCGSGLLAQYLSKNEYIGIDSSLSLVSKHITILNNIVLNFKSIDVIFKHKYFDYTIINSVLEYLNTLEEVVATLDEIERVSKKGIYIGNIRERTHVEKKEKHKYDGVFTHMVINRSIFIDRGYTIIDSLYDGENRYDAYILFNRQASTSAS